MNDDEWWWWEWGGWELGWCAIKSIQGFPGKRIFIAVFYHSLLLGEPWDCAATLSKATQNWIYSHWHRAGNQTSGFVATYRSHCAIQTHADREIGWHLYLETGSEIRLQFFLCCRLHLYSSIIPNYERSYICNHILQVDLRLCSLLGWASGRKWFLTTFPFIGASSANYGCRRNPMWLALGDLFQLMWLCILRAFRKGQIVSFHPEE